MCVIKDGGIVLPTLTNAQLGIVLTAFIVMCIIAVILIRYVRQFDR